MQIVELPSHPYFVGVQFHPEFKSRPGKPSPLFMGKIEWPEPISTSILNIQSEIILA